MEIRVGWELNKHPEPEFINICVDCPHCGAEEWFVLFRQHDRAVVACQRLQARDPRNHYIVRYPLMENDNNV